MSVLLQSMVIYEVLSFFDRRQAIRYQRISKVFYHKFIPNLISDMPINYIKRLTFIRDKNHLCFFYPSVYDNHAYSPPDELPFD